MSEKVISKFIYLSELAIKVNTYTQHDVFINFSGHVNSMELYYIKNGYKDNKNNKNKRVELFYIHANYLSEEHILKVFKDAEKELMALMQKESL